MRRSLLLHDAPCTTTTLSCPGVGQLAHPSPVPSRLVTPPCQAFSSSVVAANSSLRTRAFRAESSPTRCHRSSTFCDSAFRSRGDFCSSTRLFRCTPGVCDGARRRMRIFTTASTKEREWQEYESALQDKDLEGALEVLDILNTFESDAVDVPESALSSPTSAPDSLDSENLSRLPIDRPWTFDDLTVLDACEKSSHLMQVRTVYDWLESRGVLPSFGKFKGSASEGERLVTEAVLVNSIGLKASQLSPKKWGLSGGSTIALATGIALFSYLVDTGIDLKPVAFPVLALGFYDAIYLGGTGIVQVLSMWLPYRRRVLVHEAGHVLVAYLLGCPIRGVILNPMKALTMGIQGQAGTQFWDETLAMELSQDQLTGTTVDRYSIVLFAGIAAEAFIYGEAQGGESDENLFKSVVSQLQPSWSPAKMSNQARWAVVRAYMLVKENKKAHAAVVEALEQGAGLGSLIRAIEEEMA